MFRKIMFVEVLISALLFSSWEVSAGSFFSLDGNEEIQMPGETEPKTKESESSSLRDVDGVEKDSKDYKTAVDSDTVTVLFPDKRSINEYYGNDTENYAQNSEGQSSEKRKFEFVLQVIVGILAIVFVIVLIAHFAGSRNR